MNLDGCVYEGCVVKVLQKPKCVCFQRDKKAIYKKKKSKQRRSFKALNKLRYNEKQLN